ncbi:MAG: hypothetical protein J0M03_09080 [Acidobacteria bacterium]|nr:hypothetical protein [Acidobacteriota bacterium]
MTIFSIINQYRLLSLTIIFTIIALLTTTTNQAQTQRDFNFSISPTTRIINVGGTGNFSISLTATGQFNSPINFSASAPSGITVTFSPNQVVPPANINMAVAVSQNVKHGTYTINVNGFGGDISKTQSVTIQVSEVNLSLEISPERIVANQGETVEFLVAVSLNDSQPPQDPITIAISSQFPANFTDSTISIPGSTSLLVDIPATAPAGIYPITLTARLNNSVIATANASIEVRVVPDFLLSINNDAVTINAGEQIELVVNISAINGFNQPVNLTTQSNLTTSLANSSITGSGATRLLVSTSRDTQAGSYPVTIIARSNGVEKRVSTTVFVNAASDFSLVVNPSSLTASQGQTLSFDISLNATNNFTDAVNLVVTSSNPNITTSINSNVIRAGLTSRVTLNVGANTPFGTYDINILGSTGQIQRSARVSLIVKSPGDFNISLLPTTQSVMAGSTANFSLSATAMGGFTGNISLSATSVENITISFTNNIIPANGTTSITVRTNTNTEVKDYLLRVSASGGGITKTATFTLTVTPALTGDFTLTLNPSSQTISAGKVTSFNLSILGQNSFADVVNLTTEIPDSTLQVIFTNNSVMANGNVSATVITTANTLPSQYTIKIIGTSGSIVKTALFTLTVTPPTNDPFSLAIAPNSRAIASGEATMFTVGVVGRNGFNQPVNLSASVTNPNIQINFASITVNAGGNTFMTIRTSADTLPGTYVIIITGQSANSVVTQTVTLLVRQAALRVIITFDPPPIGQVLPPQNVRVIASELKPSSPQPANANLTNLLVSQPNPLADGDLAGYKVYRLPTPTSDQPPLTTNDLVKDENLVATLDPDDLAFVDTTTVGASSSGNFTYSVTSFFGNGQMSGGSQPTGTELPVIRNPIFTKNTIFLDAASSFIQLGAVLIVDGTDEYQLKFTKEATRFLVKKKKKGSISGKTIGDLIPKGGTVEITVRNPDNKISVGKSLIRLN